MHFRHDRDREHDRERKPRSYFSRSAHEEVKNEMRAAEERLQAQWPTGADINSDKQVPQVTQQPQDQLTQQQQTQQQQQIPTQQQQPKQSVLFLHCFRSFLHALYLILEHSNCWVNLIF